MAILGQLLVALPVGAETIDPDDDGSQFAWSENTGWINAEPLGDGGPGMRVLEDRVEGWMWSEGIGWISLSCTNRASCASVSYGVSHDGAGTLSGYAWAENGGWISFTCGNTNSCASVDYGVSIDSAGRFSGWAWGENIGWVSFSCENTDSCGAVPYGLATEWPVTSSPIFADGFESGDSSGWSFSRSIYYGGAR